MVIHWFRFRKESVFFERDSPQGVWGNMAERMLLEFAESDCPIFRATHCPEVNSKAKDMVNRRHTMQPIWKRLRLCFA